MADFYPILARAVAGLPDTSPAARHAIYERARAALVTQLRSLDPPLGEAEIMRERLSLDEAVARIEADYDTTPPRLDIDTLPRAPQAEPQPPAQPSTQAPATLAIQPPKPALRPPPGAQSRSAPRPRCSG